MDYGTAKTPSVLPRLGSLTVARLITHWKAIRISYRTNSNGTIKLKKEEKKEEEEEEEEMMKRHFRDGNLGRLLFEASFSVFEA